DDASALLRKAIAIRQNVLIFGWNRYRKDDAFERPRRDDLRHRPNPRSARRRHRLCLKSQTMCALKRGRVRAPFDGTAPLPPVTIRSEERRVGKEGRDLGGTARGGRNALRG